MKLTAKNVRFMDYSGQDNLYFEVEENLNVMFRDETPIYENSKTLEIGTKAEGTLWVKIWKNGVARFGFTQKCDPLHGNAPYTWSSNARCINTQFGLYDTPYELSRFGAGLKYPDDKGYIGCYWAAELTKELAERIGVENEELLKYGLKAWRQTIDCRKPYFDGRK